MERRVRFFNCSRAGLGLGVAALFVACLSDISRAVAAETPTMRPTCKEENQMTTCVCADPSDAAAAAAATTNAATLSQSSNGITVNCSTGTFVPSDTSKICIGEGQDERLAACNANKVSTIKEFLGVADDTNAPQWTSDHALTIPTEQFPLIDKTFFAGCLSNSGTNQGTKECLVPVSVKARASTVKNGVLTCAYGTESNNSVPAVTLDAKNNSLTIICGTEGQMQPKKDSLSAYHCTSSSTEDCKTLNLNQVMPTFTESWWTPVDTDSNTFKLVIPEGGFPVEEETILLGCTENNKVQVSNGDGDNDTAVKLPTCKVSVTLTAQPAVSHATAFSFLELFVVAFAPLVAVGTH
ncbi:UNVERIFIED_CONTAM: SAG-related sequence SRS36A [Hammondia hammondi]|eukprot:XP_008887885.1 SAG-related sequence SRS36A [Hammondia hammondi]